ncbi:MAG: acetylxylan esterase [Balneolaceae bacterium]|nr:acetylxylan esterase [Balneolaceae bacterium]
MFIRKSFFYVILSLLFFQDSASGLTSSVTTRASINSEIISSDSLPSVFTDRQDLLDLFIKAEAAARFSINQLPDDLEDWEIKRNDIRNAIIESAGIELVDPDLPFDVQETAAITLEGYSIKNIAFQSLPGVYATSNLFIPDGDGPFPAVIVMLGHWESGKLEGQPIGHALAQNGYVALVMDPWGAGERTTNFGEFEYHGGNLGASLMNIGRTLLGIQVSDNMRGVDYLASLSYVDSGNIGATGASGGGNQVMWLAAIDDRIKAAVPVVSVGTFESYVLGHNCICEVLVDGLIHTEASGVLGLMAPRALKMHNHTEESNPAFFPEEMLRTYRNVKPLYELHGAGDKISYDFFDLTHGYFQENREGMIGWFDLHLKGEGDGRLKEETPFNTVPEEDLLVYPDERFEGVKSTAEYNRMIGEELRSDFLSINEFDISEKQEQLKEILRTGETELMEVYHYSVINEWKRVVLKGSNNKIVPLLYLPPTGSSEKYVIITHPEGKSAIPDEIIKEWAEKRFGIVLADLSGMGENTLSESTAHHNIARFHTLSRSNLWLGRTLMGEWVRELNLIRDFLYTNLHADQIQADGIRETGIAALFSSALGVTKFSHITLRDAPVSYLFDDREHINFFSMAVHLPGFLGWGDVSLAAGMSNTDVTFINPVTMSGRALDEDLQQAYYSEFETLRNKIQSSGQTEFLTK